MPEVTMRSDFYPSLGKVLVLFITVVGAPAILLSVASEAQAHARLVSATPADNAIVEAPMAIVMHFNEKLVAKFSRAELTNTDGSAVTATSSVPDTDRKMISLDLSSALAPGTYKVIWHAVAADDGHRSEGSFSFVVK